MITKPKKLLNKITMNQRLNPLNQRKRLRLKNLYKMLLKMLNPLWKVKKNLKMSNKKPPKRPK